MSPNEVPQNNKRARSDSESEEATRPSKKSKMSSRMSILREQVTCPVCLDVPRFSGFFTCPNGHLVCESCYNYLMVDEIDEEKTCPTCRSKFGMSVQGREGLSGPPPRSKIADAILEILEIDCR